MIWLLPFFATSVLLPLDPVLKYVASVISFFIRWWHEILTFALHSYFKWKICDRYELVTTMAFFSRSWFINVPLNDLPLAFSVSIPIQFKIWSRKNFRSIMEFRMRIVAINMALCWPETYNFARFLVLVVVFAAICGIVKRIVCCVPCARVFPPKFPSISTMDIQCLM